LVFVSCRPNNSEAREKINENNDSSLVSAEKTEVKIMALHYTPFSKEIISNGKLVAFSKADLKFRSSENVASVLVKNGDRVSQGQVIAKLEPFALLNTLKQNRDQYEQAKLDLQDVLIGQGYAIKDSASVPPGTLKAARVKSGFDKALTSLEMAEYNLQASILKAPFSGVVANLFSKENNLSSQSDKFCTIIDDHRFEAEFPILENELAFVKTGQTVRIVPFSFDHLEVKGEILKINPVVDQNGMVKVDAMCDNPSHKLFEGMNVKIVVEQNVPHCLVIPKQAVVLRSEKQVVFTLQDEKATWNYVKTGLENTSSYSIVEGLKEGDSVIYEGNLNLAHDAEVRIMKE